MIDGASMERRHQVFVSSTYTDLVGERQAVIQALLELDCIPAGMEMFSAADEDQWTLITEVIDLCDYYVVVVGGRYGSVTPEGVSFTEKEYDYAVARGLPVLGFVHADPGKIPLEHSEIGKKARESLEAFREKVMTRPVKMYTAPDDLAGAVATSLVRAMRRHPRPGWVRGDHAMSDAVRAEIAELKAALANAEREQSEAAAISDAGSIDESYEHGTDAVELNFMLFNGYREKDRDFQTTLAWDEIVEALGPYMLDEAPEDQLRSILCQTALALLSASDNDPELRRIYRPVATISDESWGRVLVQLRALGIIKNGIKKRTVSDKSVYWTLTKAGDDYLVRLTATKRDE